MSRYDNIGSKRNERDSIMRRMHVYDEYPFVCISADALSILQDAGKSVSKSIQKSIPVVLKMLECYLAVTGQKLYATSTGRIRLGRIRNGFLGAIYSPRFVASAAARRSQYANIWSQIANKVSVEFGLGVRTIAVSWRGVHPRLLEAVEEFEAAELDPDQVTLWSAWPTVNLNGKWCWLPLHTVFSVHGAHFTTRLYSACDKYFSTRRAEAVPLLTHLANFLSSNWLPASGDLRDPNVSDDFFRKFLLDVVTSMRDSNQYGVMRDLWVSFVGFASAFLCANDLFAKPSSGFVVLPEAPHSTNIKKDRHGQLVHTKLLLDVPLQVTDQAALDLLMIGLDREIAIIMSWADRQAAEIWENHQRRSAAAAFGTPRIYDEYREQYRGERNLTHRSNPQWFENCAATFETMGFLPMMEERFERGLYPNPLLDLAYQLGLPTTGRLLPHLAILVANHNELTPSLLERLELYDEAGQECLVHQIGQARIFSGIKMRRGADLAEQTIVLNDRTITIIEQVIELTRPLRDYLKKVGDPAWRLLFLSSGQGFAYPRALDISALTSSALQIKNIARDISLAADISLEAALATARRFSLPRLRASVAISTYIKQPDIGDLARRLGHAKVSIKLLRSYLPQALLDFFQERWIRLYQCGLLCEALQGSKWRLPATGFRTEAELDEFMLNHRLKLKPAATMPLAEEPLPEDKTSGLEAEDEVLFNINTEVLTVLLALVASHKESPEAMTATARYWAIFGERVINEIRNAAIPREDFLGFLNQAAIAAQTFDLGRGAHG